MPICGLCAKNEGTEYIGGDNVCVSCLEVTLNLGQELHDELRQDGIVPSHGVRMGGVVAHLKVIDTKAGEHMASLEIEDFTGTFECILYPQMWVSHKDMIEEGRALLIKGYISEYKDKKQVVATEVVALI